MDAAAPDLSPTDPQRTVLHRIVREHSATFLARREAAGTPMPGFVVRALRRYLRCGVLAHGAALFRCAHCGRSRMTALSCGDRGFCPRCTGRRMTELAREWTRGVIPRVRVRQWVLSLPLPLRVPLAWHHDLALTVHRIAMRAIESWHRAQAHELGIEGGRTGSITVVQRFGSDLALNVHFHALALDGVYDAAETFVPARAPTHAEMERIVTTIAARIQRACERRLARDEPGESERALLSAFARSAARAGACRHAPEPGSPDDEEPAWSARLKARVEGYDLDATTVVGAGDRERLEQLCKYLLRPPLSDRRLRLVAGEQVALELKTPWKDGTRWLTMDVDTFLERLCSLVPKKREHAVIYRGVLAAHAKLRASVVPTEEGIPRPKNRSWCELMKHGLGIDVLACECGARMKHVATLFEKKSLARMLAAHGLDARIIATAPARAPPQCELDFGP